MSTDSSEKNAAGFPRRGLFLATPPRTMGVAAHAAAAPAGPGDMVDLGRSYPFYRTGEGNAGQAGIRTPPQRYIMFMTFNVTAARQSDLQVLLARWSAAIAQMMRGGTVGQVEPAQPSAVGFDTGEALNLGPASLTVTVGLGPRLFAANQFGLVRKPPLLRDLRQLPSDAFEPGLTGGDLSLQACADDPQVAYHAIRDLARIAKMTGTAETGWTVMGFGRASAGKGQTTPRNLFGFKDGTRNITEAADFDRFVWIGDGPGWQRHGTYQVVRKIRMRIENWDTDRVSDQNNVFGRHKLSGAPLSGKAEFDTPDFTARGRRQAADSRDLACQPRRAREQRRAEDPASLLQLYRRHQPLRTAGRGAAVHFLPERSCAFRDATDEARRLRCPQRIHRAYRLGDLLRPPRAPRGKLCRPGSVCLRLARRA